MAKNLFILGCVVIACSFFTYLVTFSPAAEREARAEHVKATEERKTIMGDVKPLLELPDVGKVGPMDLLRMFLGVALASKGVYFIMNMQEVEALVGTLGQFPTTLAWYVVMVHAVGGCMLIIGFATRVVTILNMTDQVFT